MSDNPLLHVSWRVPFDLIEAAHVEPGLNALVQRAQCRIETLIQDSTLPTWENTMLSLEVATEDLDYAVGVVRHLEAVATTPELRASWNAAEPVTTAFYSQIPLNEGLWKRLQQYAKTPEAGSLTGVRDRKSVV